MTVAIFAAFWLIGFASLAAVRADTTALRVTLTAPVLGSCVVLLPAFVLSHAGIGIEHVALPLLVVLLVAAVSALVIRRPTLPVTVVPVLAVCLLGLLLTAQPMREFGFHWLANANADMANYTLSAQELVHHGLLAPFDLRGLTRGTDYATSLIALHLLGSRPGADLMLASVSAATGRLPYEIFMPVIFALNLCGVCAVGALAMQASRRWWAATIAALLIVLSPLATLGVLQQLIAQVWGLAIGAALFALLMRSDLHRRDASRGTGRISDTILIAVLFVGLLIVYVELAAALAAAYGLYLLVLASRRELGVKVAVRVWLPAALVAAVVLTGYLPTELRYVVSQAGTGSGGSGGAAPLFGYALVPTALPAVLGLQELRPLIVAPNLELSVALAGILLIAILIGAVFSARRGVGAAVVLLAFTVLGGVLASHSADFGMYKLYLYLQPFLAALVAVWLAADRKYLRLLLLVPVVALIPAQLSTQHALVVASRNPVEVPHASASDLLPAFRQDAANTHGPIIAASEDSTLLELEAESAPGRSIFFPSRVLFRRLLTPALAGAAVHRRESAARATIADTSHAFDLHAAGAVKVDTFEEDPRVSESLASPSCQLALPSGTEIPLNRRTLPEGSPSLYWAPCSAAHNLLTFTNSKLGEPYYLSENRRTVGYYQLEADPYYPGRTFAGFGRYVLMRVYGPEHGARLELDFTTTLRQNGSNRLPSVAVVGSSRMPLPLVGRGSARVFSGPLQFQVIDGAPYVLLDAGEEGVRFHSKRTGLDGLYGSSIPLDPRLLTSYVRNISLISEAEYSLLSPPSALSIFPTDLANEDLEYSGIYEDGWVAEDSYAVLAGGPAANLELRAGVPPGAGKHLTALVDGRVVASVAAPPGLLNVSVHVPASSTSRRVELRFAKSIKLHAPDLRPASAHLIFLGFVPSSS
ncbi:MAG: hypothetical protein ABSB69_17785 [Solirubrobacteraceae bacterium]